MNIIELAGHRYEVRKFLGVQEICVLGVWLTAEQFSDHLIDTQQTEQLHQVIQIGMTQTK